MLNLKSAPLILLSAFMVFNNSYGDELANDKSFNSESFKRELSDMRQILFEAQCEKECEKSEELNSCREKCVLAKQKETDQKDYVFSGEKSTE